MLSSTLGAPGSASAAGVLGDDDSRFLGDFGRHLPAGVGGVGLDARGLLLFRALASLLLEATLLLFAGAALVLAGLALGFFGPAALFLFGFALGVLGGLLRGLFLGDLLALALDGRLALGDLGPELLADLVDVGLDQR